jgi:hypothetical protein
VRFLDRDHKSQPLPTRSRKLPTVRTTMQLVCDTQLTDAALAVPNLIVVALVSRPKPVPGTVTLVPPLVGPPLGLTLDTVGKNLD